MTAPEPISVAEPAVSAPPARSSNFVGAAILAVWLALGAALIIQPRPPHVLTFAFVMVGWLVTVMAHEFAHAFVGWRAGDHTVKAKGYLDFDPRRYGSWQTSLFIPLAALALGGVGFPGGSVYLRTDLMRSRLWRSAAALAGPAATAAILLALAAVLDLWASLGATGGDLYPALSMLAFLQAMALILNLLPIPGLDGFNAIRPFLPPAIAPIRRIEGLATLALLALIFFVPGGGTLMFGAAALLSEAFGLQGDALQYGWDAFHFWR